MMHFTFLYLCLSHHFLLTPHSAPPIPPSLLITLQHPLLTPLPLHASPNTTFIPHNPFNLDCSLPQLLPHHLHSSPPTHQFPLFLSYRLHSTLPSSKSTPHSSTHSSPPSITLPLLSLSLTHFHSPLCIFTQQLATPLNPHSPSSSSPPPLFATHVPPSLLTLAGNH